jgi:hypothetical protein
MVLEILDTKNDGDEMQLQDPSCIACGGEREELCNACLEACKIIRRKCGRPYYFLDTDSDDADQPFYRAPHYEDESEDCEIRVNTTIEDALASCRGIQFDDSEGSNDIASKQVRQTRAKKTKGTGSHRNVRRPKAIKSMKSEESEESTDLPRQTRRVSSRKKTAKNTMLDD